MLGSIHAGLVDIMHDMLEALINFLARPVEAHAVLTHFKTGNRHTACVCSLTRTIEESGIKENVNTFRHGRHIRAFGYHTHAIGYEV